MWAKAVRKKLVLCLLSLLFLISSLENLLRKRLRLPESRLTLNKALTRWLLFNYECLTSFGKHLLSKAGVSDDVLSGSVNTDQLVKACTGKGSEEDLTVEFVSSTDGKIKLLQNLDLPISQNLFLLRRQILHLILQNILQN